MSPKFITLAIIAFLALPAFGSMEPSSSDRLSEEEIRSFNKKISRTESNGKAVISLVGANDFPSMCDQPDSTIPIGLPFGPNPYSGPMTHFVVLSKTDVEVRLFNPTQNQISQVNFDNIEPGPYRVEIESKGLSAGRFRIQIWNSGKMIQELVWVN